MANNTKIVIVKNSLGDGIKKFAITSNKATQNALAKGGLQLINWIINGSPNETVTPPIKDGLLRGSGSVFVGNKFISATPRVKSKGDPNLSYSGKKNEITVGFNTAYAAAQHENLSPAGEWQPGEASQQADNVGGHFVLKHLIADKELLYKFIAKLMKEKL